MKWLTKNQISILWIGWRGSLFAWNGARFNSGYPYYYWRIGPLMIKRYWK